MHVLTLGSGSGGNATLVRAGETHLLLDAGLELRELEARFAAASVAPRRLDHIALTHGHLDHARSAGRLAKKTGARVHCAMRLMKNASLRAAPTLARLPIGTTVELLDARGMDAIHLTGIPVPHDADPTVAFRVEAGGRVLVLVTDMGRPAPEAMKRLRGAHVAIVEFNYDPEMLRTGPYPSKLKRRVSGGRGHLSNEQGAEMVKGIVGPETHTLVLAHLSQTNNTRELARAAAQEALAAVGRDDVRILIAEQDEIGTNLNV